jgi:hypothetical protein
MADFVLHNLGTSSNESIWKFGTAEGDWCDCEDFSNSQLQ